MMRTSIAGRLNSSNAASGTKASPQIRSAQVHSQAGMTLLEVVVVMVLFVILSGIAAPKIWTMLHTSSAEREMQSFVRFMEQSVDAARTRQQTVQVQLNMATGAYVLSADETVLKKGQFSEFHMESIQMADKTLDAGKRTISIKRAGIADETALVLRNQDDLQTIHILPFRGKTVVYDGAQQLVGKKGL